ncbi:hypothetical protein JXA80_11465 [bacterium]|nr:hypothetical protein [candidate division CSSED10-310 bacterium]
MKRLIGYLILTIMAIGTVWADPFPDAIIEIVPGSGGGYGSGGLPDIVLGPPVGAGLSGGSLDVFSLGDGGSITLQFVDNRVFDGPGTDLIIFENPFYVAGNPENVFCEVAFVEVSMDGETFFRFPNDYNPDGQPVNNPDNWLGFAGVIPVISHPDNGVDPTDPLTAGGDCFDLADVGLSEIRFIRIIDTGEGDAAAADDDGDTIDDPGMPGGDYAGFDLDAIAAVHSIELFTPTPEPTATPTPEPTTEMTPTPTPEPTFTGTATPSSGIVFDLALSGERFTTGDAFILSTRYLNEGESLTGIARYIILDVEGLLFFCPGWTQEPNFDVVAIPTGESLDRVLDFVWPEVSSHLDGVIVWGGIVAPDGCVLGNVDWVEFSF